MMFRFMISEWVVHNVVTDGRPSGLGSDEV
jgi:hypothetical protein